MTWVIIGMLTLAAVSIGAGLTSIWLHLQGDISALRLRVAILEAQVQGRLANAKPGSVVEIYP